MTDSSEESELERAIREADEAEAKLRRMKERLIPKDRAEALRPLLLAEVAAMTTRVLASFEDEIVAATTDEDARAVSERMQEALDAGLEGVKATMSEQLQAWTLAGLEDRAKEGLP
jgi:sugar-specific transcriptional regulator TrmB